MAASVARSSPRVAPRLREDAQARVHQDDGRIRRGGPGGHVARVLKVSRRVGDDDLAPARGEVAVGHVDGDALLALGAQAVGEEREVNLLARAGALHRRHLVLEEAIALVEEPANQGGLPIIDGAHHHQPQQLLLGVLGEEALELFLVVLQLYGGGHQKYPSRFFSSIEPSSS